MSESRLCINGTAGCHGYCADCQKQWRPMQAASAEVRVIDPTTGGQKGIKPERFDLLPWEALEEVARVYAFGAEKYEDHNWWRGYKWSLSLGALFRHISRWMCGETNDQESGLHHLAHATFHCLTLISFQRAKRGTDDRRVINRPGAITGLDSVA
jgi:hypothetical protein